MKQLFLMSASFLIASGAFAQMDASDNTLYKFNNTSNPKEVRKLGSAPEFPFLRNLTSSRQVYNAIKSHNNAKLNDLLMQIGYENGAKDLQASDITEAWVPVGTEGNMGSRGYTYGYYKLAGDAAEFKAWKIQPNEGSSAKPLYLFSKCGNAFYPNGTRTACISVPVNVTPDMKQVTLPASGSEVTTTDKVYVYYAKKRHNKDDQAYPVAGVNDKYISTPIQVNSMRNSDVVPETYTVSLNSRANDVTACTDKTLDLIANVNVEKTSTYTGNYPKDDHKVYKKVTKHQYKVIARKMRKAQKKADKIARRTETSVEVRTEKKA